MRRFMIERKIPGIGAASVADVRNASKASNAALEELNPDVQWVESYLTDDRTYCIYLAKDEAAIRKHGKISGIPVTKITEIHRVIDPLTAHRAKR